MSRPGETIEVDCLHCMDGRRPDSVGLRPVNCPLCGCPPRTPEGPSITQTLQERGARYGEFHSHAQITQNLKATMRQTAMWGALSASQTEALEMIAHKIGRILNGDPNYLDSWTDIVGYAQLICDQLEGKRPK